MQVLKLLESSHNIHVVGEGILDISRTSVQLVSFVNLNP